MTWRGRAAGRSLAAIGFAAVALSSGCATVGTSLGPILDPLNVLGSKPPSRIGITRLEPSPLLLVPKAVLFEENLTFELGSPFTFDLMTPRQIRLHLGTGRLKFALLTAGEFSQIAGRDVAAILAVQLNEHQQTYRQGLIVVPAGSPIRSPADLKGLRFHFLSQGHPLNDAALGALLEAGVSAADLDKGLLGLSIDQYHISSMESARGVVLGGERSAGVIDKADYDRWPASGGSLALLLPSKDQVRVIAETVRVPEGPFVVSKQTDPRIADQVRRYLLNVLPKRKLVLASLGCSGFAPPIEEKEYEPFFALYRRLHPDLEAPSPDQDEAATRPAPSTRPGA
ncbi:MAG: PhnD/SsuA/transferrin family substrate-binding protein [Phycisphaerae bacterium]